MKERVIEQRKALRCTVDRENRQLSRARLRQARLAKAEADKLDEDVGASSQLRSPVVCQSRVGVILNPAAFPSHVQMRAMLQQQEDKRKAELVRTYSRCAPQ